MRMIRKWVGFSFRFRISKPLIQSRRDSFPEGTDPNSPEFFAVYQHLIYDYYMEQTADILDSPGKT